MALEGIKKRAKEFLHGRWEDLKASPKEGGKGVVGGIADATVLNVYNTVGDILKGPVREAVQGVIQPIGRTLLAGKELITGHPGKMVTQLAIGAEKTVEHAVNVGRTAVETAANAINRIARGVARTVAGCVGENIFGARYKDLMREKTVALRTGLEGLATGEPSNDMRLFEGGAAAAGAH